MTLDQGRDVAVVRPGQEIAFPERAYGRLANFRQVFAID
jgi:hypothetical protein